MKASFSEYLLDVAQGSELDFIGATLNRYCASQFFERRVLTAAGNPVQPVPECDAEYRKRMKRMVELLK